MKRILTVLLCSALVFLAGCKSTANNTANEKNSTGEGVVAVASFYPIYVLALNVTDGVEGVKLERLMESEGACAHDYQLTTDDLKALDTADVLLINGLGMEGFLGDVSNRYKNLEVLDTSRGTNQVEASEDDDIKNAHVWLSVPNAVKQVENIRDAFIRIDPKNEQQYRDNTEKFTEDCRALMMDVQSFQLEKRQNAAIFHEGFDYFASDFGFDTEIGLYSDENEAPSAKEVAEAIEEAKEDNIKLFFAADDSGQKLAETISAEVGGRVILLDPITGGADNKNAYKEAMEKNIAALGEALKK